MGWRNPSGARSSIEPDLVISTSRLNRLIAWEPDDMTVVVEGGMGVEDLESRLAAAAKPRSFPRRPDTPPSGECWRRQSPDIDEAGMARRAIGSSR